MKTIQTSCTIREIPQATSIGFCIISWINNMVKSHVNFQHKFGAPPRNTTQLDSDYSFCHEIRITFLPTSTPLKINMEHHGGLVQIMFLSFHG